MTGKSIGETKNWLRTAETIIEALPYMIQFAGQTIVVKYGGHAMGDATLARNFALDVVLLKQVGMNPIVVHGGGPQIGQIFWNPKSRRGACSWSSTPHATACSR